MFCLKKRIIAILCFFALIMSPSLTFAGQTWGKIKKNITKCEIKIQGCTTDQWTDMIISTYKPLYANSGSEPPKLSTKKKVLYTVGAAIVVAGAILIITNDDSDDPTVHAVE